MTVRDFSKYNSCHVYQKDKHTMLQRTTTDVPLPLFEDAEEESDNSVAFSAPQTWSCFSNLERTVLLIITIPHL